MANRINLNQTSYHGAGAIEEIANEAKAHGFKKAFVCSDPDLVKFHVTSKVTDILEKNGLEYKDFGCYSTEAVDYPVYAKLVAKAIQSGECEKGILICGTGIGISITANKIKGIRAAVCTDCFTAEATRLHNDANILALGGRVVGPGLALKIVDTFLNTPFSNDERHIRRINQI